MSARPCRRNAIGAADGESIVNGCRGQAGLDASQTYQLDLTGIASHPIQGTHIKLTVNAEGGKALPSRTRCSG